MQETEILRRIEEIEDEKERRHSLPLYRYNGLLGAAGKLHRKQAKFHKSLAQERWVFGGNRTGKTECGAAEAVLWATGLHPFRDIAGASEGWVVSLSMQVQRDVAQRKILHYLDKKAVVDYVMQSGSKASPERGVIDYILVNNKFGTVSKIGFKSCDQGREKFQGVGLDWVWFDEEPPEDIYEECLLRTLDKSGCIWGTMTPLKGRTWVYERVFLSPEVRVFQMSWEDNPFLSSKEVKKMESNLSASSLESRKHGRFMEGTGLVFPEFTEENIIAPFSVPRDWAKVVSIDPGLVNPTAVIWLSADGDGNMFVIGDYAKAQQSVEHHAKEILAVSDLFGFERNRDGSLSAIIDSAALQNNLGSPASVAKQFRSCGIDVDTRVNKDVLETITRVKSRFCDCNGVRRLFIFNTCMHLIKELRTYLWGENQRPVKRNDHCIDALRYAVCTDLQHTRRVKAVNSAQTPVGAMKQQLMRLNRANM